MHLLFIMVPLTYSQVSSLIESGRTNVSKLGAHSLEGFCFCLSNQRVSLGSSRRGTSTWRWSGSSPVGVSVSHECVFTQASFSTALVGQLPREQLSLSRNVTVCSVWSSGLNRQVRFIMQPTTIICSAFDSTQSCNGISCVWITLPSLICKGAHVHT